jgi:hypothetical protein
VRLAQAGRLARIGYPGSARGFLPELGESVEAGRLDGGQIGKMAKIGHSFRFNDACGGGVGGEALGIYRSLWRGR